MEVQFRKKFRKEYQRLPKKAQQKFNERLQLFLIDPEHALLHTHALRGKRDGYMSFNVTADIRAIFLLEEDIVTFYHIGSHSELYS